MKFYICKTVDYSLIESILEKLNSINKYNSNVLCNRTTCVYLEFLENGWQYECTNDHAVKDFWIRHAELTHVKVIDDIDLEVYLEKHRGSIVMNNLNLF